MNTNRFLAELFDDELYIIGDPLISDDTVIKGDNKKGIVVLIEYPNADFLPGDLNEFFNKILGSVSLSYKDIAVINLSDKTIKEIPVPFTKLLTFGVSYIPGHETDMAKYKIFNEEGIQILNADSLKDISENKDLKVQLWNSIRNFF